MRKKRSLIVSLALAFVLLLSAPFALTFNKKETAQAEVAFGASGTGLFLFSATNTTYQQYLSPMVANASVSGVTPSQFNTGIALPIAKQGSAADYPMEGKTMLVDVSNATKDDALISFNSATGWRSYKVQIHDGTNYIDVFFAKAGQQNGYLVGSTNNAVYVQAGGQSLKGGMENGAFVSGTTGTSINVNDLTIYYDASEKAIYTNNASGEKVLVRDLDATDDASTEGVDEGATNGGDTAFAGFSGPVRIKISHNSGGGAAAPSSPNLLNYGVVVTTLNGLNLVHNGLGYLASSYNLTDGKVSKGAYVSGGETTIPVGDTYTIPALERLDGEALASGEADGWTTTVYNVSKEDVTADVLVDNVFTATERGTYYIYRTKTVESTTTVVSEKITAVVAGFENEYANIFEAKKATDGVGIAEVSLPVDLQTGVAETTLKGENRALKLTYGKAQAVKTLAGNASDYFGRSFATVKSVNISDNTKSDSLVSLYVKSTAEIGSMAIAVTEVADPTNGFVVSTWIGNATEVVTRVNAGAFTQHPFGTRGSSSDTNDHMLAETSYNISTKEHVFAYDKEENAVYINGKLVRDFDATGSDAWKNGANRVENASDPVWNGFKTDEVQVHIITLLGAGDAFVSSIDGNDLSYKLIETASGYTAGLETPIREDNYNATTFANIGETVVVPAPTSKKITGEFTERTDITVAKVRVNGAEAVAYEKGVTSFTAVAGLNTIEYLDGSDGVIAKAYVQACDDGQNGEITGGTVTYGMQSFITGLLANHTFGYHTKDGMGVRSQAVQQGLKITAQRPAECLEDVNERRVVMALNKTIYVGDNDTTAPLVEFSYAPDYISQQLETFGIIISDGVNEIRITTEEQISEEGVRRYYRSVSEDKSPVFVFVNGVKTNLRQNSSEWYNGRGFIAKNVYTAGFTPGKLSIYYDKATETLSVGSGQSNGDNEILVHLNPSASDITTYNYPASRPCITLGDEVTVSFEFTFNPDTDYEVAVDADTAPLSGKQDTASMLISNIDGQSLVQVNGAYVNNGLNVAKTVADDNNFYKVGDTVTLPAVTEYYNVLAEGGVVSGAVTDYTVDVKKPDGTVANADLAPGANFTATEFGVYTLVYKFSNRANVEKTIKVTKKTITLTANDVINITVDTTDNNGLGGTKPNYTLTEGGYVNVKITPASGYAITSAKIDGVEKITKVDLTGAQLSFMVAYADIANASTLEATVTAFADIKFTISYDANGGVLAGTAGTDYKVEYAYSDATFALPTTVTKTGYTFAGWFDGSDNRVEEITQYSSTNYVLTARWTANEFTATFNSAGGSAVADQTIYYDGTVTAPVSTRVGYTFGGWFEDGATEPYDFDTLVTGDVNLTAKWKINDFVVTFSDGIASQTISFGGKVTKPADPTKAGFTFGGWLYGATVYDFDTLVSSNMALTAIWTPANVTVTFDLNGGTGEAPAQSVVVGALAQKPVNPTKDGYVFVGWFIGDDKFDFGTEITANTTLTAKYVEVTEDVTPDAPEKESEGCGKEAVGLLAVVLSALAVVFVTKRK